MDKEEGQSAGRTTGASGEQAEQQQRTIEGQDTEPGKVWQEGDKAQYTGQGDTTTQAVGAGTGGESSGGSPQGSYASHENTNVGGSDPRGGSDPDVRRDTKDEQPENADIDESQWQGNRFGQGGFGSQGGSNG